MRAGFGEIRSLVLPLGGCLVSNCVSRSCSRHHRRLWSHPPSLSPSSPPTHTHIFSPFVCCSWDHLKSSNCSTLGTIYTPTTKACRSIPDDTIHNNVDNLSWYTCIFFVHTKVVFCQQTIFIQTESIVLLAGFKLARSRSCLHMIFVFITWAATTVKKYRLLWIKSNWFDFIDSWCQLEDGHFVKWLFERSHVCFIQNLSDFITTSLGQIWQD